MTALPFREVIQKEKDIIEGAMQPALLGADAAIHSVNDGYFKSEEEACEHLVKIIKGLTFIVQCSNIEQQFTGLNDIQRRQLKDFAREADELRNNIEPLLPEFSANPHKAAHDAIQHKVLLNVETFAAKVKEYLEALRRKNI